MEPNLNDGNISFVLKRGQPNIGDVILVTNQNGDKIIKRLIAKEGDVVEIHNNTLFVNDRPLNEEYIKEPMLSPDFPKIRLREGEFFVLGDNRNNSLDSRSYGIFSRENYFGKAIFLYEKPFNFKKIKSYKPSHEKTPRARPGDESRAFF